MSRKIKPNKLFNDAPKTKDNETSTMNDSMNAPQSEAEIVGADTNCIVGNGRMSAEDVKKLEQFEAMQASLAALTKEKSELEAKIAEYVEKIERERSLSDEVKTLSSEKESLISRIKELEDKCSNVISLELKVKELQDENDQYLIKISELTFDNANLTSQLSDFEMKLKGRGTIANQDKFTPTFGSNPQMSRHLAAPLKDAYNPYANNGYGTW